MMEQMILFEEDAAVCLLSRYFLNADWKLKLRKDKTIIIATKVKVTKTDLFKICSNAHYMRRFVYGFSVLYEESSIKYQLTIRFLNNKPKAKDSVYDYINKHFEQYANDFYKSMQ